MIEKLDLQFDNVRQGTSEHALAEGTMIEQVTKYLQWANDNPILAARMDWTGSTHSELLGFARWLDNKQKGVIE